MLRRLTRLLITLLCTALLLSVCATTAEAKGRKGKSMKIFGISRAGQDWYNSRMIVKWRPVRGASYQMRVSWTPSQLGKARVISTGNYRAYTGQLDRGKAWYVQVRAIRSGKAGPWSRARALKFLNTWPGTPTLRGRSLPGAVEFNWGYTANASRYRVQWNAAWYGQWPASTSTFVDRTSGGWVNQYARKSVFRVPPQPGAGDNYLAVDYANPVFGQLEANNGYRAGAYHRSRWVPVFPAAPTPRSGDPVRLGTYNVMLYPTGSRAAVIANNIASHGVTVAALQEANTATANAVASSLGSLWSAAPSGAGTSQQVLYRRDKFNLLSSGKFGVSNPKAPSTPIQTPWARLQPTNGGRAFYVVSAHFSEAAGKTPLQRNRDTGIAALETMRAINGINSSGSPVIVAGDIRYSREPYGDPAGYTAAHPTFVRGGYYDAMAALKKTGYQYSTVNIVNGKASARQTAHPSGLGPRSDHILVKGFKGSFNYANVYNWSKGGVVPSDHNLLYADLQIPRS